MALWSIDIEKRLGSEFWSNRYIVSDLGEVPPSAVATSLVAMERTFHSDSVLFTRHRVSSMAQGDGLYNITPLNVAGQRSTGSSLLPLFNTLRVEVQALVGRPSRKYYRGVLQEGDIAGDALSVSSFTGLIELYEELLAVGTNGGIVDPQGGILTNVTIHPFVQMRQLRRSRRKRANGAGIFQ